MKLFQKLFCFSSLFLMLSTVAVSAEKLPKIHIIATGGTIAGSGASSTAGAYEPGKLKIEQILEAVPELGKIAQISSEQLYNVASQDLTQKEWLQLSKRVNELLASPDVDGIVITHGTDVMEETAYFLNLTVKSDKPVVLTGAMRPATSLSADGPLNLYNAVLTAADEASKDRGVLIVMNGEILGARDATKENTLAVQTFQSPNSGPLGEVHGESVYYKQKSEKKHTSDAVFDVSNVMELPRVAILYGYADEAPELAEVLTKGGFDGIVHAGVGNGNIPKPIIPILEKAQRKGISVVRSSRIPVGETALYGEVNDAELGFVVSRDLSPQKARILLMLALMNPVGREQLQNYYNEY